jgi:hypothetical protein
MAIYQQFGYWMKLMLVSTSFCDWSTIFRQALHRDVLAAYNKDLYKSLFRSSLSSFPAGAG